MIDASMEETPEMMRKEIEETKLQLAEKIETLEKQVAETVKTTENAVNATVGAVQGTVHSVTAVVDNAVQSVNHFLDLQQQIDRHPFLVVGGAVVAGYLAAEFLTGSKTTPTASSAPVPQPLTNSQAEPRQSPAAESVPAPYLVPATQQAAPNRSLWSQLEDAAIGSLVAVIPQITLRVVPRLVDQLIEQWNHPSAESTASPPDQTGPTRTPPASEAGHGLRIAAAETERPRSR